MNVPSNAQLNVPLIDLSRLELPVAQAVAAGIDRVRDSGQYLLGQELAAFEADFAALCGTKYCIGVANGTDALELALRVLGCGPGDTVATVANAGMYATVAILAVGARPLYIDIDGDTMTMSATALGIAMTPSVKVVIATHLYGRLADMAALAAAAGDAALVEDCAQAHGALRDNVRAGAFGAIGCFSFYPTKNLGAMGDAGALTTNDPDFAEALYELRIYGWRDRFVAARAGGQNSRLDEMQAAVLAAKLPFLEEWNARRREIAAIYAQELSGFDLELPDTDGDDHVVHLYVIRTRKRDDLATRLDAAGIGCAIHYPMPDYRQPALIQTLGEHPPLAEVERALPEILTLPCHPWMADDEVKWVATSIRHATDGEVG